MSENQKGQNQSDEKKGGASRLIIIIGAVIIVLLVALILILLFKKTPEPVESTTNNNDDTRKVAESARIVLDEESAGNIMDEMRKEVEEGMFECQMSMTWTFADGTSESSDAIVVNSSNNTSPFYFDVTLNDTGELIYSSPVVPVGSQISNIKLDKDLDPGEYKATVMYSLLEDEENQVVKSQAGFVITINVYE